MKRFALFAFVMLIAGLVASAQHGLDPSFGTGGRVTTIISANADHGHGVSLIQPDGKILIAATSAGYAPFAATGYSSLLRYNSDGSPDTTFGGGTGRVTYSPAGGFPELFISSLAVQSDGKIVMVSDYNTVGVFRVNADGSPDTSFGTNGLVTFTGGMSQTYDGNSGIVFQSSGKIVIGYSNPFATLVRLNANGTVDNSFGPSGNGSYSNGSGSFGGLAKTGETGLVLGLDFGADLKVIRFNADGLVDINYGSNGVATIPAPDLERITSVAVQPDGKVVVAGRRQISLYGAERADFVVGRFDLFGLFDFPFGFHALAFADFGLRSFDRANTVAIQSDGTIVLAGYAGGKFALARFDANGVLLGKTDPDGFHSPAGFDGEAYALAQQSDGKLVVTGYAEGFPTGDLTIARYTSVTSLNNATIKFDYDADRRADVSVFRSGTDCFWYSLLTTGFNPGFPLQAQRFGVNGDIPVPGDYTGDGMADFAVFRPSNGTWYNSFKPEMDPTFYYQTVQWGQNGDIPAPGDFDGDAKLDRVVFRPVSGVWYIQNSSGGASGIQFGTNGDKPVAADYDGDGKADIAVVRDVSGSLVWYILESSTNNVRGIQFGIAGDKLTPTDFTGDGRAEIAVFRPGTGSWYILSNYAAFSAMQWGANGDVPAPADYDYDGKADLSVFRPTTNSFYTLNSGSNTFSSVNFGISTDIPLPSAYVR